MSESTIFVLTCCVNLPGGSATEITELSFSPGKSNCILWVKGHWRKSKPISTDFHLRNFPRLSQRSVSHLLSITSTASKHLLCQTSSAKPGEHKSLITTAPKTPTGRNNLPFITPETERCIGLQQISIFSAPISSEKPQQPQFVRSTLQPANPARARREQGLGSAHTRGEKQHLQAVYYTYNAQMDVETAW